MIAALLVVLAMTGGLLDGFEIGHVPRGVGERVSDFSYEWEDVRFSSRVWERRLDGGGHRVDLMVLVLRGERLSTPEALRAFLSRYGGSRGDGPRDGGSRGDGPRDGGSRGDGPRDGGSRGDGPRDGDSRDDGSSDGGSGYGGGDPDGVAYRLVEPGIAVVVKVDAERFGPDELWVTAAGVRPSTCSGRRGGLPRSRCPSRPG